MATIVVVAESSALSLALATTQHEIVEARPADAGDYEVDLYVVDLEEPLDAVVFLGDLSAERTAPPAVVVIGDSPGWQSVRALETSRLAVVERPVGRPSLVAAVEELLRDAAAEQADVAPPIPVQEHASRDIDDMPASAPAPAAVIAPEAPSGDDGVEPVSASTSETSEQSNPPSRLLRRGTRTGQRSEPAKPARSRRGRQSADVADVADAAAAPPLPRRGRSLANSADEVLHAARRLQGLDIVACDTVGRAMAAVDGTAGALLLRDGDEWRTAGGLALRPREWMAKVSADSWLVSVVAEAQQAVVIEDTDIVRQRLANVPLSRFHNLLAIPLPRVQGVLLVARDEDAFDVADMQSVAEVGEQATTDLAAALLLRDIADALHRFAERRQL